MDPFESFVEKITVAAWVDPALYSLSPIIKNGLIIFYGTGTAKKEIGQLTFVSTISDKSEPNRREHFAIHLIDRLNNNRTKPIPDSTFNLHKEKESNQRYVCTVGRHTGGAYHDFAKFTCNITSGPDLKKYEEALTDAANALGNFFAHRRARQAATSARNAGSPPSPSPA